MAGIERKHLEFTIELHKVQFNHLGKYELQLTVQSSYTRDYSRVKLSKNQGLYLALHSTRTGSVVQEIKNAFHEFDDQRISFFLPRGFCKNDTKHDVYLLVEAHELPTSGGTRKRVGEAKYAIFPRTNAPRANIHAPPEEDMYRATDVMTLLRTLSSENLKMHCGRLKYTASLRQIAKPPKELTGVTPTPEPSIATPDIMQSSPQKSPTPPPRQPSVAPIKYRTPQRRNSPYLGTFRLPPQGKVAESPSGAGRGRAYTSDEAKRSRQAVILSEHVSSPGQEEVVIIVHAGNNMPFLSDGRVPIPFCFAKTKSDEDLRRTGQAVTSSCPQPSHKPEWEEVLSVNIPAENAPDEVLIVNVADRPTKELLADYRIPVSYLVPFHSYHLHMITPTKNAPNGVSLYVTIIRKCPTLPRDLSSPNYIALEVVLQAVENRLSNPVGPLTAVARVVPDYYFYKFGEVSGVAAPRSPGGVTLIDVMFPSPPRAAFSVSSEESHGFPQVTLPGLPAEQPTWNHSFVFCENRDKATLFTPGAALVFELFPSETASAGSTWKLEDAVGYASLLLDQAVYQQLTTSEGARGLRIQGLPVQGTNLLTDDNKAPTLGGVLRLITSVRSKHALSQNSLDTLPLLDLNPDMTEASMVPPAKSPPPLPHQTTSHPVPHNGVDDFSFGSVHDSSSDSSLPAWSPSKSLFLRRQEESDTEGRQLLLQRKIKEPLMPIQDGELPAHDALENILPEYQYIFVDPQPKPRVPGEAIANNLRPEDVERGSNSLLDYQMRELEKYRAAVHRMGQDILTLREQIRDAEAENSRLRRDLSHYNDATRLLMDSQELDGLTKPELASRYVAIKQKLSSQTGELQSYKDTVQRLHNELIKRNDAEKNLMKMSHAHESQNELLQRLQDKAQKVKRLEDACRKQEKVIEKMERLMGNTSPKDNMAEKSLQEENKRLRAEIADLREAKRQNANKVEPSEQLETLEKLERADSRIRSLEKQLSENARKWGRERSDLLVKLQEAEHGFWRSAPLHFDYINPKTSKDQPLTDTQSPRRYSKAPPKQRYGQSRSPKLQPIYH